MVIVQKENVQYKVSEEELNRYLNDGFVEIKAKKEIKEPVIEEKEEKEIKKVK